MVSKVQQDRQQRLESLRNAQHEVGPTSQSRLSWLVDFARTDISRFNEKALTEYGDRLLAIGFSAWPANLVEGWIAEPAATSDVLSVHAKLREVLEEIVLIEPGTQSVEIPIGRITVSFIRMTARHRKPAAYSVSYRPESLSDAVLHALKDLVFRAGERLIACKNCNKPIIANRKREYCDSMCAKAHRDHKEIKSKKEEPRGKRQTRTR